MVVDRKLKIDDYEWLLSIYQDGQISFAIIQESDFGKDPMDWIWRDWFDPDSGYDSPTYSYDVTAVVKDISPFRLKREIMNALVQMIRQSHKEMFYFKTYDKRKGRIYTNLTDEFIQRLGGDWSCQAIEDKWFYFTKNSNSAQC